MAPKLILADLDGTLLDEKKHLTPRSRAALERSAASGAQVVIATGRFFGGVPDFLKELPFLRYFILMNGAKVYDLSLIHIFTILHLVFLRPFLV